MLPLNEGPQSNAILGFALDWETAEEANVPYDRSCSKATEEAHVLYVRPQLKDAKEAQVPYVLCSPWIEKPQRRPSYLMFALDSRSTSGEDFDIWPDAPSEI